MVQNLICAILTKEKKTKYSRNSRNQSNSQLSSYGLI